MIIDLYFTETLSSMASKAARFLPMTKQDCLSVRDRPPARVVTLLGHWPLPHYLNIRPCPRYYENVYRCTCVV